MLRFTLASVGVSTALAQNYGYGNNGGYGGYGDDGGYGQPSGYAAPSYGQPSGYSAPSNNYGNYGGGYGGGYNGHGRSEPVHFPPPYPVLDPNYYATILSRYSGCVSSQCSIQSSSYSTDISTSISNVASYTACVTSCAAAELYKTVSDFRDVIGNLYEVGFDQLRLTRQYLAGEGYYDVLGNRTHIGDSCCLPNEYFVDWDKLTLPVSVNALSSLDNAEASPSLMVTAPTYLQFCAHGKDFDFKKSPWIKNINCDDGWVEYLQFLQSNIGNLVLAPFCQGAAPDGACSADSYPNPRATAYPADVCVAVNVECHGRVESLATPLIKPVLSKVSYAASCPPDQVTTLDGDVEVKTTIYYERVAQYSIDFYTVTDGLPSGLGEGSDCKFDGALAAKTPDFFGPVAVPSSSAIQASYSCPNDGTLEYCSMEQYASYLQEQLFDVSKCLIDDFETSTQDDPSYFTSIACLYKIYSLKCDCMAAVLQCYSHQTKFGNALSQTIGQAASILCGYILCQRPDIYQLFGGEYAIEHSVIMSELLQASGLMSVQHAAPAAIAFVAFGLGMVAFVVVKRAKQTKVEIDDGYQNLL